MIVCMWRSIEDWNYERKCLGFGAKVHEAKVHEPSTNGSFPALAWGKNLAWYLGLLP
jgi:hypothetical protein